MAYQPFDKEGITFTAEKPIELTDTVWEDLRVSIDTTSVAGSHPPTDEFIINDGNYASGSSNSLHLISEDLTILDSGTYDWTTGYSIEFWFKPTINTSEWSYIAEKPNGIWYLRYTSNGKVAVSTFNYQQTNAIRLNVNSWNHVVLSVNNNVGNGNDETILYINNVVAADFTGWDSTANNSESIIFNRDKTNMQFDNIVFWDKPLSASEVNTNYNNGEGTSYSGVTSNVMGLWKLNETTGTTASDSHATSNDGTVGGIEDTDFEWIEGLVNASSVGSLGVLTKLFSDSIRNEVFFTVQFPHHMKIDSEIRPHVHWIAEENGGAGEKVRWGLEYTWSNINETFGNTTIIYAERPINADGSYRDINAYTHLLSPFPVISTGKGISSMMFCRLFRDAEHADDDFSYPAGLLEFDFHYQIDMLGSQQEYRK